MDSLFSVTLLLRVLECPFDCHQTVGAYVLLICMCAGLATLALVERLAGLGSKPERGVVASRVLMLSGPRRSPGGGSMGGGRMGKVPNQGPMKSQYVVIIHPCAFPLLQLVQPDTVEGSGVLPTIELCVQHQLLDM